MNSFRRGVIFIYETTLKIRDECEKRLENLAFAYLSYFSEVRLVTKGESGNERGRG
jgi:hypothetical protein